MLQIKGSDWGKIHGFFAKIKAFRLREDSGWMESSSVGDLHYGTNQANGDPYLRNPPGKHSFYLTDPHILGVFTTRSDDPDPTHTMVCLHASTPARASSLYKHPSGGGYGESKQARRIVIRKRVKRMAKPACTRIKYMVRNKKLVPWGDDLCLKS